ncbi:MAG: UvrD-helicase domain-containing protein [Candidatus Binataceae bacterium]|nr:UvrD-helicase domain-containing protein [Candidatus Binataceae bacterium]
MATGEFIASAEQARAIGEPGHLLVRAGAGSGKTEVLARRFAALVAGDLPGRDPLDPERLAAITFGERAAHDLRERLARVLEARRDAAPPGAVREHLERALRRLPLARISTIHAFCARILRENPLAAGLDPGFEVIDEYESAAFLDREGEHALIDAVRRGDFGARRIVGARGLRGGSFREGAIEITIRLIGALQQLGRPPQWLIERAESRAADAPALRAAAADHAARVRELTEALLALKAVGGAAAEKIAELRVLWPQLSAALAAFDADSPPSALAALRRIVAARPDARAKGAKEIVLQLRDLLAGDGKLGLSGKLIDAWGACRAIAPTLEIARFVARAAADLDAARRRDRVVTFGDLLALTRDLLRDNPDVAQGYREALGALMVDEYQDVDPIQDEIVDRLTDPAGGAPAPELFIVGDEKQSIYRFRGADVTVFKRARGAAPQVLPLSENRRSAPNILGFVNALGGHLMAPREPAPGWWVAWSADHHLSAVRPPGFNPPVELIAAVAGANTAAGRTAEAAAIATRIGELIAADALVIDPDTHGERPARPGDVAILLRAFSDVAIYERALRRAAIACYTVKGRGFFGCQEIVDLIELLTVVNDPADSIALAATLRSPLFALSDDCLLALATDLRARPAGAGPASLTQLFAAADEPGFACLGAARAAPVAAWRVLRELRLLAARAPLVTLLERALELTAFEAVLLGLDQGRQRVANLRKLLEFARAFESRHFFTFHDFIGYLRGLTESEPHEAQAQILGEGDNVVRLMTIHQAKGLEFPIVFVADLGRRPRREYDSIVLSPADGLLLCDTTGSGSEELPNAALTAYRDELHDQEEAEAARLLYVAITRARDRLILSEGAASSRGAVLGWASEVRTMLAAREIDVAGFAAAGAPLLKCGFDDVQIELRQPPLASPADAPPLEPAPPAAADRARFAELARSRLGFAAPDGGDLVMSPTALADFARCPRQYYFRHELNLPEGAALADAAGGADPIARGLAAHAILERLDLTLPRPALVRRLGELAAAIGTAHGLDDGARAAIVRDLARYAASPSARLPASATIARELPFFLAAGRAGGAELFVRGQIDLLIDDGARMLVRDYKYARAAAATATYQVPMECYALAAATAHPARIVSAEIVYLRDGPATAAIELPAADAIRAHLAELTGAIVSAYRTRAWPARPTAPAQCRALRCGYLARCWGD